MKLRLTSPRKPQAQTEKKTKAKHTTKKKKSVSKSIAKKKENPKKSRTTKPRAYIPQETVGEDDDINMSASVEFKNKKQQQFVTKCEMHVKCSLKNGCVFFPFLILLYSLYFRCCSFFKLIIIVIYKFFVI